MIKIEIDEEKLKEFIGKFVEENIKSIAYKISMKEITELIQEEVKSIVPIIVEKEVNKLREEINESEKRKWWWHK